MKDKKKESFSDYEIFHIHRIMSVLMEAEFPANTHAKDGKSDCGTHLFIGLKKPREQIIRSMFELGYFSHDEFDKIKKICDIDG